MVIEKIFLGTVDYHGKFVNAFRKILDNGAYQFVIETDSVERVLITY